MYFTVLYMCFTFIYLVYIWRKVYMKTYYKLLLEATAIIGSVLFSFYIEDLRKKSDNLDLKNALIEDLIDTIEDDLEQLKNIQDILSLKQEIDLYKPFYEITGHCFTGGLDLNKEITLLLKATSKN